MKKIWVILLAFFTMAFVVVFVLNILHIDIFNSDEQVEINDDRIDNDNGTNSQKNPNPNVPSDPEVSTPGDGNTDGGDVNEEESNEDNSIVYPDIIDLDLLYMNDVHGHVEMKKNNNEVGLSNASYLINEIRNKDSLDNTLVIANGDMFQETALSYLNYGAVVIESLNQMNIDCMGIGNHEFDWGFDKVLNYFDGDQGNLEANFPMVNSNIIYNNNLLLDNNICESLIIDKGYAKIGVISLIGNIYASINYKVRQGYSFNSSVDQMTEIVTNIGTSMKDSGVNIIIVNIHGGSADGASHYEPNIALSKLKYNGEYLVDAVINGHTHHQQAELIIREDGVAMPVGQAGSNLSKIGNIALKYDTVNKKVIASTSELLTLDITKYDQDVEDIIDKYVELYSEQLYEFYCKNNTRINRKSEEIKIYAANLMMAGTNSEFAIFNDGIFRSDISKGDFLYWKLYQLTPFEHEVMVMDISGDKLLSFITDNPNYISIGLENEIDETKIYKLAILDSVYYSSHFKKYRIDDVYDTHLTILELMKEDLLLRKDTGFDLYTDCYNVLIGKMI